MGVDVDPARRHQQAARVDHPLRRRIDRADLDDLVALDADIGEPRLRTGSVNQRSTLDQ
ncbi:hypothetical protein ACFSTI_17215 [Rhizorhabdus histidinilytica]